MKHLSTKGISIKTCIAFKKEKNSLKRFEIVCHFVWQHTCTVKNKFDLHEGDATVVSGLTVVAGLDVVVMSGFACVDGLEVVTTGQSSINGRHRPHLALKSKSPGHIWHADPMLLIQVKNCCSLSGLV